VDAAQSRFDKAKSDYARFERLHKEQVIADKQFDEYQNTLRVAQSDLAAARERYALTVAGPRTKQIEAARHEVDLLSAAWPPPVQSWRTLTSSPPWQAWFSQRDSRKGNSCSPAAWWRRWAATKTAGSDSTYLLPYWDEFPWRTAEVRVDSFPERIFPGFVSEIAQEAEFTPRMSLHPDERANLVFRVKVSVPNEDGALKSGMPADVVFP
jgi:HlyD family secretion protein